MRNSLRTRILIIPAIAGVVVLVMTFIILCGIWWQELALNDFSKNQLGRSNLLTSSAMRLVGVHKNLHSLLTNAEPLNAEQLWAEGQPIVDEIEEIIDAMVGIDSSYSASSEQYENADKFIKASRMYKTTAASILEFSLVDVARSRLLIKRLDRQFVDLADAFVPFKQNLQTELDNSFRKLTIHSWNGFYYTLAVASCGMVILLGLVMATTRRIFRPILTLSDAMSEIVNTGNLSKRITAEGDDEAAELTQGFNVLLGHLEKAQENLLGRISEIESLNTELSQKGEDLEILRRRQEATLEAAADAIITIDQRGTILSFNQAAQRIFGYGTTEVLGRNVSMLMPATHAARHDSYLKRFVETGTTHIMGRGREVEGITKEGKTVPIYMSLGEARSISGTGERFFVGILRDLSEIRSIESKQRWLARAVESTAEAVFLTDMSGLILEVNPAFVKLTGFEPKKDAIEMATLLSESSERSNFQNSIKHLEGGQAFSGKARIGRPGEGLIYAEYSISPVFSRDGAVKRGFVGVVRDISEKVQHERALEEACKRAEAAKAAKDLFVANMSHELRTPLYGIMGMAEKLKETTLTVEQVDLLEIILSSARLHSALVNDILDFAKLERGTSQLQRIKVTLPQLISDIARIAESRIKEKGQTLILNLDDRLPCHVLSDPVRLQQVLLNLLGNACKYTADGGCIILSALVDRVSPEAAQIKFVVTDTGIGIPGNLTADIFEPFTQLEQGYSRPHEGAGLGLSIASKFVELLGGTLCVRSRQGVGSAFFFTIPFALDPLDGAIEGRVSSEKIQDLEPAIKRGCNINILIADDNIVNQKIAVNILSKAGYQVSVASDGLDALRQYEAKHFDLVLMDIQMPKLDGLATTLEIREREKGKTEHIPIVAFTAHAFEADLERYREVGMDGHITKPIDRESLLKEINRILKGTESKNTPLPLQS